MTDEQTPVEEAQEGKSLDELAGEGQIATPEEKQKTVEALNKSLDEPDEDVIERCPQTEEEIMKPVDFKTGLFGMRSDIELVKSKVKKWMKHPLFEGIEPGDDKRHDEINSNLVLAYRHLEDARMRLGKAVQAYDGGKSCYPR